MGDHTHITRIISAMHKLLADRREFPGTNRLDCLHIIGHRGELVGILPSLEWRLPEKNLTEWLQHLLLRKDQLLSTRKVY